MSSQALLVFSRNLDLKAFIACSGVEYLTRAQPNVTQVAQNGYLLLIKAKCQRRFHYHYLFP